MLGQLWRITTDHLNRMAKKRCRRAFAGVYTFVVFPMSGCCERRVDLFLFRLVADVLYVFHGTFAIVVLGTEFPLVH